MPGLLDFTKLVLDHRSWDLGIVSLLLFFCALLLNLIAWIAQRHKVNISSKILSWEHMSIQQNSMLFQGRHKGCLATATDGQHHRA